MKSLLPSPVEFKAIPDSKAIRNVDGLTAIHTPSNDLLTIICDETQFILINIKLNGTDPVSISIKHIK